MIDVNNLDVDRLKVTLLSPPKGRIGPSEFQTAALILIGVTFVLNLLPITGVSVLGMIGGLLSLVLIYPWVCIWVKRLHDAGKAWWYFLIVIVAYAVINSIAAQIVASMIVGDLTQAMMEAQTMEELMQAPQAMAQKVALPSAILSALIAFGLVFAANKLLPSDAEANKFGPPTSEGASGAAEAANAEDDASSE